MSHETQPATSSFATNGFESPARELPKVLVLGSELPLRSELLELLKSVPCETVCIDDFTSWKRSTEPESWSENSVNGHGGAANSTGGEALVVLVGPLADWLGEAGIRDVREAMPAAQLVVYTSSAITHEAIAAMRAGASHVLTTANTADARAAALDEAVAAGVKSAAAGAYRQRLQKKLATLTPAEEQVLEAMLVGMANKQIAQALEIGLRTVELRRSKIMRKMDAKSLAELVKLVCIAKGLGETS